MIDEKTPEEATLFGMMNILSMIANQKVMNRNILYVYYTRKIEIKPT